MHGCKGQRALEPGGVPCAGTPVSIRTVPSTTAPTPPIARLCNWTTEHRRSVEGRLKLVHGVRIMPMKFPPHPRLSVRHDCLEPLGLNVTEAARRFGISRKPP